MFLLKGEGINATRLRLPGRAPTVSVLRAAALGAGRRQQTAVGEVVLTRRWSLKKFLVVAMLVPAGLTLADDIAVNTSDTDRGYRHVTHAFRHMEGAPAAAVERPRFEPTAASSLRGQHGCPCGSRLEDISGAGHRRERRPKPPGIFLESTRRWPRRAIAQSPEVARKLWIHLRHRSGMTMCAHIRITRVS